MDPTLLKRLSLARGTGFAALLLGLAAFTMMGHNEIGFHFGQGRFVSIANATAQAGWSADRHLYRYNATPRGFYIRYNPNRDWSLAWRPFHAADPWNRGSRSWNFAVVPLWPLMPIGAAIAAYAHGVLVGMRRTRTSECHNCGYDLRKTPIVDGKRKCPECGLAAVVIETAGGTPAPPDTA